MEAQVDTLSLLAQPKEGQQQIQKQKITRTARKSNYGNLTIKVLKEETFIQTIREWGGWRQTARAERMHSKAAADRLGGPTFACE